LAEFFVFFAHLWWDRDGISRSDAAVFGRHANTLVVLQVSWLAEASSDALRGAHSWMWVGAGWGTGGTTGEEHFVVLALCHFWWVGEEHGCLGGFAFLSWNADAVGISQVSFLAEASDDALPGADGAWVRVGAGRSAGRAAWVEHFIVRASWHSSGWFLHGDFGNSGLAVLREHALALSILQESLLTETPDDALESTDFWLFLVGAIWNACRAAMAKFGISTAFFIWKSRDGNS
jgi:hypothetical protein